jgi:DNA-binding beta-propeller fold protein YncE
MQRTRYCAPFAGRMLLAVGVVVLMVSIVAAQVGSSPVISSTIPHNGDLNPYGIVFVPEGFPAGTLTPGDVLVSNFNNNKNLQGLGTTIIKLTPNGTVAQPGKAATFFTSKLSGLSTALGVLRAGLVVVGNVPTKNGKSNTVQQGALQFVDGSGNVVTTLTDRTFLDGPWDLTINDRGSRAQIFVSNVLNGTVSRLDVMIGASTVDLIQIVRVAQGYTFRTDPSALVVGPTGLAYDPATDVLYVASTGDNAIFAVAGAGNAMTPVDKERSRLTTRGTCAVRLDWCSRPMET